MSETPHQRMAGPVHEWFELTYSSHLVLPRVLMQSMPLDWQQRMTACLREMTEGFEHVEQAPSYKVEPVSWHYPEDLGGDQLEALGITYHEGEGGYLDARGSVVEGRSVAVPARDPLPHYRHGYVEPHLNRGTVHALQNST